MSDQPGPPEQPPPPPPTPPSASTPPPPVAGVPPTSGPPGGPTGFDEAESSPSKPWWKRWWVIALGLLLILFVIAGIAGGGDDGDADEASMDSTDVTVATAPVETPATESPSTEPPVTPTPTEPSTSEADVETTPAPTEATTTPAPTEPSTTPAPTSPPTTPAPTSPPTTAAPVVVEGSGDSVQSIVIPGGGSIGIVTFSHTGSSNFSVVALDQDLNQIDLLVNEIGSYSGTVLIPDGAASLEIGADGAWRAEVKPIIAAEQWDGTFTRQGDDVVFYTGDSGVADITHAGESNFAIFSYPLDGGRELLVNEIGAYTGSVRFPGPALLQVSADGEWSITLQ